MSCTSTRALLLPAAIVFAAAGCAQPAQSGSSDRPFWALFDSSNEYIVVPQGTELRARLEHPLNSASSYPGEPFVATVTQEVRIQGDMAVPEGALVHGVVKEAEPAVRGGGDALLVLDFQQIELPDGNAAGIRATLTRTTQSRKGRNAAIIGGSAAGGAILGRIIGKDTRGAVVGTIVGGAVGTGIVMAREGEQVNLPDGTLLTIRLESSVEVPPQA